MAAVYIEPVKDDLAAWERGDLALAIAAQAGLVAAKTIDRLNRGAQRSFCAAISVGTVLAAWVDVFFGISGGKVGAQPVFPNDPSTAFFACFIAGMITVVYTLVRLAWLLSYLGGGRMKEAQDWGVWALVSGGILCAVLSVLN